MKLIYVTSYESGVKTVNGKSTYYRKCNCYYISCGRLLKVTEEVAKNIGLECTKHGFTVYHSKPGNFWKAFNLKCKGKYHTRYID